MEYRLDDLVLKTCNEINVNTPGGFINQYGNKYIVRGMARTDKVSDLANSVIKVSGGLPVKISDVAV